MRLFRVKLIEYLQRYMKASKWNKQYNGQIHIKQWQKKKKNNENIIKYYNSTK